MTRPVEGFLTKDGQFFSSEHEAKTYEAITDLNETLLKYLEKKGLGGLLLDYTLDNVRYFLSHNKEVVGAYIEHVGAELVREPPDNDIRLIPPEPTTEPLVVTIKPVQALTNKSVRTDDPYEPYPEVVDVPDEHTSEEDLDAALESEFVSGFEQTVGTDDPPRAEAGDDEVVRQPKPREPDVHQRIRGGGISVVAE